MRSTSPLPRRLAKLFQVSEQSLLEDAQSWHPAGDYSKPCYFGPGRIRLGGKIVRPGAAIYELIHGEPKPPHLVSRKICNTHACGQPHHWTYRPRLVFGGEIPDTEPENAGYSLLGTIQAIDGWENMSADEISDEFGGVYTAAEIAAALPG